MPTIPTKILLEQALVANNLAVSQAAEAQLLQYLDCLTRWNHVFNLTAIIDPAEMVTLHVIDSLVIAPCLCGNRMLDVGSGAGLPGIPLAIVYPELHWTLLDKNGKKTRFLMQAVAECGLKNVEVVQGSVPSPKGAGLGWGEYHTIVARAFTTIASFAELVAPLLAKDGSVIAMKGRYPTEELADLSQSSFAVQAVLRLEIKGLDAERHVVMLKKK
ncbi:MAG: hypothetical protein A3F43_05250 [Gammaproteobacteria bacterium RIFCSPHIGHO2_12_FULL_42_10]|nr:MAG: hypothetical protein A3F43_05250 [Gammaproteobacteria bacterium RIFCSPHIGHO2_12_FULL_42_10]